MSILLPREMAESNRRVADSVAADAWHSTSPGDANAQRRRGARAGRELTRFAVSRKADVQSVWEGAVEALAEGMSGEEARETLDGVRDVIDSWLALAQKTRELWREVSAATGAEPEGLDELGAAERDVKEVHAAVEKMYAFVVRSRPPIDPALLRKGREEIDQGHSKTPEAIRSSLDSSEA